MTKTKIEPFKFSYMKSSLDWYEEVKVEINDSDFKYFTLQLRYGNDFYLMGCKKDRDWCEDIGRMDSYNIKRFIEWCKRPMGSKLLSIEAISTCLNVTEEILKVLNN